MLKTIAVRGKKDLVAVFLKYAKISGQQDTSRPKAATDFIKFVAELPLEEKTKIILRTASKHRLDESEILDEDVPVFMKIPVEIDSRTWEKAMGVFRYVFQLKNDPQMPYFLRVAGTAYIRNLEEQDLACTQKMANGKSENLSVDEFRALTLDKKVDEIYRLLIERRE